MRSNDNSESVILVKKTGASLNCSKDKKQWKEKQFKNDGIFVIKSKQKLLESSSDNDPPLLVELNKMNETFAKSIANESTKLKYETDMDFSNKETSPSSTVLSSAFDNSQSMTTTNGSHETYVLSKPNMKNHQQFIQLQNALLDKPSCMTSNLEQISFAEMPAILKDVTHEQTEKTTAIENVNAFCAIHGGKKDHILLPENTQDIKKIGMSTLQKQVSVMSRTVLHQRPFLSNIAEKTSRFFKVPLSKAEKLEERARGQNCTFCRECSHRVPQHWMPMKSTRLKATQCSPCPQRHCHGDLNCDEFCCAPPTCPEESTKIKSNHEKKNIIGFNNCAEPFVSQDFINEKKDLKSKQEDNKNCSERREKPRSYTAQRRYLKIAPKSKGTKIPKRRKLELYYFNHGNANYLCTTDKAYKLKSDKILQAAERKASRFWAEFFGAFYILLTFITSFFLQLYKFCLYGVIRHMIGGFIQITSDYAIKPFLTITFNSIIQPVSIFFYNILVSVRDLFQPIAACFGFFLQEIANVFRSVRLIDYHSYHKYNGCKSNA